MRVTPQSLALSVLLLVLLGWSGDLAGQRQLRVAGDDGAPVPFTYVLFQSSDTSALRQTNELGEVMIPNFVPVSIRASVIGYAQSTAPWESVVANDYQLVLIRQNAVLETATVVGRRDESFRNINQQVGIIGRKDIERAQSFSTADALAELGGVYVQKSQFGGGSPVLRGFEANRVLLVVDGVRMNNAIYRNGHLQNAITVDPLGLDRMELIYGAGALAYGSDAIGGVVHFRTEQPRFRAKTFDGGNAQGPRTQDVIDGKIAMSYGSAARASALSTKIGYGGANWAGLTLLSTTSTSHLRAGAQRLDSYPDFGRRDVYVVRQNGIDELIENPDPNRQVGSAYDQVNLLQKFRFRLQDRVELNANLQYSSTSNIPRYDNLTQELNGGLRWARWDYGPQTRAMASVQLLDRRETSFFDVASYLVSHQFIEEDRIARRRNDPAEEHNLEDVHTTNLQFDFSKKIGPALTLRYGLDGRYDMVDSKAFFRDVDTREESQGVPTRYPSAGSSLLSAGLYLEGQQQIAADWQLRGGFRLSRQRLSATFGADDPVAWPQVYLDGITNTESATTVSVGLREQAGWRFLYSQGFRAPNIDDFAKFRERNGFIQAPNPDLLPERSHTLEAAYTFTGRRLFGRRFDAEITGYHTWLRGVIARQAGSLPNGDDFFVSRGDTLRVQANVNANSARVWGFDLVLGYQLTEQLRLKTEVHYLYGRRQQAAPDGEQLTLPQDHIPPPYGATSLHWEAKAWALGFRLRYQLAKNLADYAVGNISGSAAAGYIFDRMGTSDNLEFTPFLVEEGRFAGTYGWWTANIWVEWSVSSNWTIRLKVDNLLDRHYRTFASGISAPGLNMGLGVEWAF